MSHVLVFITTFAFMEWLAWAMHKYVMHGPCWFLHEDHHFVRPGRWWQKNDAFALFFAVPSFLSILFGTYYVDPHLATFGYGIMAYGVAYFLVHEGVIHRRVRFFRCNDNWYCRALIQAHRDHHRCRHKQGARNFGMLMVPLAYFRHGSPSGS